MFVLDTFQRGLRPQIKTSMKLLQLACLALLAPSTAVLPASAQNDVAPKPISDFTLQTLQGDSLQLYSLRGNVVLLNLWATWCTPCLEEMPDLNTLHEDLGADGLVVVGLSVDKDEDRPAVQRFAERLGVTYPVVYGSVEVAQSLMGGNAAPILPTTFLIDAKGFVAERIVGKVPLEKTRQTIAAMLRR